MGAGGGTNIALHTSEEESEWLSSSTETEAECHPEEVGARCNAGDAPADADAEVDVENTLAVAMGSEGAATAAEVPPVPAALTAQELASLAAMGPDGTITCGSAPWSDLPRICRITTWPFETYRAGTSFIRTAPPPRGSGMQSRTNNFWCGCSLGR